MTDPWREATKDAMRNAGCRVSRYGTDEDPVWECCYHLRESRSPGVCGEIDAAVRIGYEAGRRDAITGAADRLERSAARLESTSEYGQGYVQALHVAASSTRSLLTTTEKGDTNGD